MKSGKLDDKETSKFIMQTGNENKNMSKNSKVVADGQATETEKKVFKTGSMPDMTGTNKDTKNNNDFMNALIRGEN